MSIIVHVPVRVRVDADALARPEQTLQPPVEQALSRALEASRQAVLVTRRGRIILRVDPPTFRWTGGGAERVSEDLRRRAERAIEASLRETARTHGVHNDRLGRRARRPRGPFSRGPAVTFKAQARTILEWMASLDPSGGANGHLDLYREQLEDTVDGAVFVVQANEAIHVDELADLVAQGLPRLKQGLTPVWGYTTSARPLGSLGRSIGIINVGTRLGFFPPHAPGVFGYGSAAAMAPGARLLFVVVAMREVAVWSMVRLDHGKNLTLPLREAGFIARAEFPEVSDRAEWDEYAAVVGETPVMFDIVAFVVRERIHASVLTETLRRAVYIPPQGGFPFQATRLLNRATLAWLPPAIRAEVQAHAGPASLDLDPSLNDGYWEPDWCGIGVAVVVPIVPEALAIARARPVARQAAEDVRRHLSGDPDELMWPYRMESFLKSSFGGGRTRNDLALELFFDLLEQRGDFVRMIDMIEGTGHYELIELFINLAYPTRYGGHDRVRRAIIRLQSRTVANRRHHYDIANQRLFLFRDRDLGMHAGTAGSEIKDREVAAHFDSFLLARSHGRRLRPEAIERIRAQMPAAQDEVLHEAFLHLPDTRLDPKALAEKVLALAAKRANLTDDDIPEVLIERSFRLLKLETYDEGVIERIRVTYEFVQRFDGGAWESIEGGVRTVDSAELEEMLTWWRMGESGRYLNYISMGVVFLAVAVIAWEVGALALLVELGGGLTAIGISIAISELIYLYRVITGNAKWSLEGFFMAALDGYLMAVGFRLAAPLGRIAGSYFARGASPSAIKAYLAERLTIGAVGGASTGAMLTFSHDVVNMAMGRQEGFSPWYVWAKHIGLGAVLGIVAELGLAGGQAALKVAFPTTARTMTEAIAAIRAARISGDRWALMSIRAVRKMYDSLRQDLDEQVVMAITRGFRERSREILDALVQSADDMMLRRLLELGEHQLTDAALLGLERTIAIARGEMSESQVRAFVERIAGLQRDAAPFLDFLGRLDDQAFNRMLRQGQVGALLDAPLTRQMLSSMDPARAMSLLRRFEGQVGELEQFASRIASRPPAERAAIYEAILGAGQRINPHTLLTAVERLGGLDPRVVTQLRRMSRDIGDDATNRLVQTLDVGRLRSLLDLVEAASQNQLQRLGRLGILDRIEQFPNVLRYSTTRCPIDGLLRTVDAGGTTALGRLDAALAGTSAMSAAARRNFIRNFADTIERETAALSVPQLLSPRAAAAADALAPLVGGARSNTGRALGILRGGGANDLLQKLEAIAVTDAAGATRILDGIGRYFEPASQADFRAMLRFLESGGSTEALGTLLAYSRNYGPLSVARALRQMSTFSRAEMQGLEALVGYLRGTRNATDRLVGIATNYEPAGSVFQTFGEIIPASSGGLDQVIGYAASGNQNFNQAALGTLRAGREILAQHPGARLRFEVEAQTGGFLRISDIMVTLPSGVSTYLRVEIKEVVDFAILETGGAVRQFARDVHLELQLPPAPGAHRLSRLRWMVRRPARPGGGVKSDAELLQDRQRIRMNLRKAFDNPVIGPESVRRALRDVFDAHFDEIVQFF